MLQWAKLVDKKRDEAEAERRRQIEESHALLAAQEQAEKEEMARQAALEVEDAMSKYSASRHSISMSSIASPSPSHDAQQSLSHASVLDVAD